LSKIKVEPGQSIDDAIKQFNQKVRKSGTMREIKKHNYYEKPGVQKRNRIKEAKRNRQKNQTY
jgi:small subunit ribosomal protein S21